MEKFKGMLTSISTYIPIFAGLGAMLLIMSYNPATSYSSGWGSRGASIEAFPFALGIAFIVIAVMLFINWLKNNDHK